MTDLRAAVLAYLEECAVEEVPPVVHDAPVFERRWAPDGTSTVHHVSGRPDVTAVSVSLLDAATEALGWDGECLTMPGDLRYRPVGLDPEGYAVVCRRVGP